MNNLWRGEWEKTHTYNLRKATMLNRHLWTVTLCMLLVSHKWLREVDAKVSFFGIGLEKIVHIKCCKCINEIHALLSIKFTYAIHRAISSSRRKWCPSLYKLPKQSTWHWLTFVLSMAPSQIKSADDDVFQNRAWHDPCGCKHHHSCDSSKRKSKSIMWWRKEMYVNFHLMY